MIFSETWQRVLDGTKTETTRFRRGYYKVGHSYAVQSGRGKAAAGRIMIDECGLDSVLNRCESHYHEEGFQSQAAMLGVLLRMNGSISSRQTVYWFRFHLISPPTPAGVSP